MANTSMVATGSKHDDWTSNSGETLTNEFVLTKSSGGGTSSPPQTEFNSLYIIRESYRSQGLSEKAIAIIMHSWRNSTKAQYSPYIKLWFSYCGTRVDYLNPPITTIIEFLADLHTKRYTYPQLCLARSALSSVIVLPGSLPLGRHPLVKRFMKGVFELDPHFPRYKFVWDVSILFNYFRSLNAPEHLSLEILGKKLAIMLSILAGGQRCQTIHAINALHITIVNGLCHIPLYTALKQTRHGKHLKPLGFAVFTSEPKLCVITNLCVYLKLTKPFRTDSALFLSYHRPHRAVSKDTIARWSKGMMAASGIDTTLYVTHSSRSAAASFARKKGLTLNEICDACGWSNESTFANHYNKEILPQRTVMDVVLN